MNDRFYLDLAWVLQFFLVEEKNNWRRVYRKALEILEQTDNIGDSERVFLNKTFRQLRFNGNDGIRYLVYLIERYQVQVGSFSNPHMMDVGEHLMTVEEHLESSVWRLFLASMTSRFTLGDNIEAGLELLKDIYDNVDDAQDDSEDSIPVDVLIDLAISQGLCEGRPKNPSAWAIRAVRAQIGS